LFLQLSYHFAILRVNLFFLPTELSAFLVGIVAHSTKFANLTSQFLIFQVVVLNLQDYSLVVKAPFAAHRAQFFWDEIVSLKTD
jgi:hypothetical protein